ncbi:uncharacterized protein STEHIDRAFT_94716 [Stereum hirsutum FP-91666 SS1]|uniref:uncharacterized protein n=1 Tax=Stereum hirsutum (strain FP-91666) TaxID=721885 RepID=UPI000440F266|nr:uncharacterized protein STEHIDRAFT_94716 [Stereum hirsutum FP-91666 SS1]EIM87882.1 hypothetical protein STEHIDRAFT_94716 [Stereum hirsutum FP-91666 SS1]
MIKKRTRPNVRVREVSPDPPPTTTQSTSEPNTFFEPGAEDSLTTQEEEDKLSVAELVELRKLRKARQGIDVTRLNKPEVKKKKKKKVEEGEGEEEQYGLKMGTGKGREEDEDDEMEDKDAKARRAVRTNNFTQQTNALDVDKHMMAYIEENMKLRHAQNSSTPDPEAAPKYLDPQEELYRLSEKYKVEKKAQPNEEGSVTNSLAMLTAIPEVDLGMDTRLKNIEETEKAKQALTQARKDRQKRQNDDEEHLAAARFFRPNTRMKSDADIIRDAKLEAMGLPPAEDNEPHRGNRPRHDRPQMATDEMVMERFKKRMRK